jgi:23S rRNA (adenine2030-N6)-methyltransferase
VLSYRHIFHAGNFADVFKHVLLSLLLQGLKRKDKPFFYLDSHAGCGRYDLTSSAAQKNREYAAGIGRLWQRRDAPAALQPYLEAVAALNPSDGLRQYPGSPWIARHSLRPGDRMVLCELHPSDFPRLEQAFAGDPQVQVRHMDGYQALKACLPPPERRGLVHIDPAFELADERQRLLEALQMAHRRWATGIYAVWFPLIDPDLAEAFYRRLRGSGIGKILLVELCVARESAGLGMYGTGMAIVNPPWQLDEDLTRLLPYLHSVLAEPGQGRWRVAWLQGE